MTKTNHNYTHCLTAGNWIIELSPSTQYGYFENQITGSGGGLWFEDAELVDYDGVGCLPAKVAQALVGAGWLVPFF